MSEDRAALDRHPELQGAGGVLRDEHPSFFIEVSRLAGLIEPVRYENGHRGWAETGNPEAHDKLDAILEDVKLLIQIDPDMRR